LVRKPIAAGLAVLRRAFELAGVEFIDENGAVRVSDCAKVSG